MALWVRVAEIRLKHILGRANVNYSTFEVNRDGRDWPSLDLRCARALFDKTLALNQRASQKPSRPRVVRDDIHADGVIRFGADDDALLLFSALARIGGRPSRCRFNMALSSCAGKYAVATRIRT
jgi:hypothetical protein